MRTDDAARRRRGRRPGRHGRRPGPRPARHRRHRPRGGHQVSFGSRAICISRHSLEVADRLGFGEQLVRARAALGRRPQLLPRRGGAALRMAHGRTPSAARWSTCRSPSSSRSWSTRCSRTRWSRCTGASSVAGCTAAGDEVDLDVDTAGGPPDPPGALGRRRRRRSQPDARTHRKRLQGTSYEGRYVIADIHWQSDLPDRADGLVRPAEQPRLDDDHAPPAARHLADRLPARPRRGRRARDPGGPDPRPDRPAPRLAARTTCPWTLEWHGFYRAHALALDSFVHGRVALRRRRRAPGADLRRPRAELRHGGRRDPGLDAGRRRQRDARTAPCCTRTRPSGAPPGSRTSTTPGSRP